MINATNCPISKPTFQPKHTSHPSAPPQEQIIHSKDEAIQQLIYENTMLKKQLSELILRTTPPVQYTNFNSIQTSLTSPRPSISHFGSNRNSLENSIEFSTKPNLYKTTHHPTDNVCENPSLTDNEQKAATQRQIKRSHRHSVDNLCTGYQTKNPAQIHPNFQNKPLFSQNQTQLKNQIPLIVNQGQVKLQTNTNLGPNTFSEYLKQQENTISEEEEMYREKMMKLKSRSKKGSHTKRLSEEKPPNIPVLHVNPVIVQSQNPPKTDLKPIKLHEVLREKLNSPEHFSTLNPKAFDLSQQPKSIRDTNVNQTPSATSNAHDRKMFPRYTPKKFSKEKQNRVKEQKMVQVASLNLNAAEKTVQRMQTDVSSQSGSKRHVKDQASLPVEQKQVCMRQLRGKVYLDDEGEGNRTKRGLSRSNSTMTLKVSPSRKTDPERVDQATKRNNVNNEIREQKQKRIGTAQSRLTYVDAESFKKMNLTEKSCGFGTEKAMVKKNQNRVYLEEDEIDRNLIFRNRSKSKSPRKIKPQENVPAPVQQAHIFHNIDVCCDKTQELVSIEQLHMISDRFQGQQGFKRPPSQSTKRSPPLARQNSTQNCSTSKNKNLYNQVYCVQSKKDLNS